MPVTINGSNTPTAGGVTYGDGTQYATTSAGSSGQLLQSNGASAPSWVAAPTTSPAGSNTQIQYNNSGAFGASSTLTYDGNVINNIQANGTNSYIRTKSGTVDAYYGAATSGLGTVGVAGTFSNNDLVLYANSAERFRIGTAGQLGIGGATYGTSGQVLTSGGSGAAPTWSTPAGGFTAMDVITTSSTYTIPAGKTTLKITVVGAGGGGGFGAVASGTTGGTSSVASGTQSITTISATGGARGIGGSYLGGVGGVGSGGTLNFYGGDGGGSSFNSGTGGISNGGSSYFGGGGYAVGNTSSTSAGAGHVYGGGGGGTYGGNGGGAGGTAVKYFTGLTPGNTLTITIGTGGSGGNGGSAQGGAGADGVVVIEY